jgi:hypothetical protein
MFGGALPLIKTQWLWVVNILSPVQTSQLITFGSAQHAQEFGQTICR